MTHLLLSLTLFACTSSSSDDTQTDDTQTDSATDTGDGVVDADNDGSPEGEDCDDSDPSVYPGADEICDDIDQDCDNDVAEDFEDLDGDGTLDCIDDVVCVDAPTGLIAWWQGEDTSESVQDLATTVAADVAHVAGAVGDAVDLSATGSGLSSDPDFFLGAGSRSVEGWIRTSDVNATLFAHYECGWDCSRGDFVSPSAFILAVNGDGVASLGVRDLNHPQGVAGIAAIGTTELTDGAWHHVAGVVDVENLEVRLYVDGVLEASTAATADQVEGFAEDGDGETDPITLGYNRPGGGSGSSSGATDGIDEVSVYDTALTDAEVAAIHRVAGGGKCDLD